MEIVAALFVEGIDFRQVAGPSTRIDITGAFFSTSVDAYPAQLDPISSCSCAPRPGADGNATLETVFCARRRGDRTQPPDVLRRARQVRVPPGEGRARVPRAGHDRGRCTIVESGSAVTVPLTALLPACRVIALNPDAVGRRSRRDGSREPLRAPRCRCTRTPVEAVGEVAGEILEQFDGERPDLLVCFASPQHTRRVRGRHRRAAQAPRTRGRSIGCTAVGGRGRRSSRSRTGPGCRCFAATLRRAAGSARRARCRTHRRRLRDRRLARRAARPAGRC